MIENNNWGKRHKLWRYPYKVIKNEEWFDSKEFKKVSPLGTQHINFLGKYIFEEKEINTEDGLRPLKIETVSQ